MMLRPMANLFAVADPDPSFLDWIEDRLAASREFDLVWRPAPGWVAARAPLPESEPDGGAVRSMGFAFVEGRDRLERSPGFDWLNRVAKLADASPARLAELPGDFGFVRFRPDGTALAVRSCGGLVPFYLHRTDGGGLALGTLLNYFPRFIPARFHADPLINASWDPGLRFIDGRTFVDRVSILPRASHTELLPGRAPRTGIYWDPRPETGEELKPSPEHPRELRKILIETLSRDLDPQGRNLLLLSGGVDSCAVGALAAGTVGRGLSAWSLIPAQEPDRSHELAYIDSLVSRFGIAPAHRLTDSEEDDRQWTAAPPGLPFQVLHPALCDLPRISAEQEVRVMVCGIFADEVCGHRQRMRDWVRHTSLPALLAGAPPPFGRRDYRTWARVRLGSAIGRPGIPLAKELPTWARPEVAAEYHDWLRRHRASRARDRRPLKEFADRVCADGWVAMNWEGTAPLGIRRSLPFFNREVLDLAFDCHPSELLGPGPKRLLRDALRHDVPAMHLLRSDKGAWRGHLVAGRWPMDGPLPSVAQEVLRSDWLLFPPPDLSFYDGKLITYSIRVAEYLERQASPAVSGGLDRTPASLDRTRTAPIALPGQYWGDHEKGGDTWR
jgi:asparagine synthetase B (glutamine-hydrolysing)